MGLLVHGLAADCNAVGVTSPTTEGEIFSTNNFQSGGVSTGADAVTIKWRDGSGAVVDTRTATPRAEMPFDWNANHTLPATTGITVWAKGTGKCSMFIGGVQTGDETTPPII